MIWDVLEEWNEKRNIKKAPRVKVAAAQPGEALRLVGHLRSARPLAAPITGRPCAAFHVLVRVRQPGDDAELDMAEARGFELEDDSGRAIVQAEQAVSIRGVVRAWQVGGAGSDDPPAGLLALLKLRGVEPPGTWRGLVVEESVLEVDSEVLVYGFVDHELAQAGASYREAGQRVVVRQPLRITADLSLA